MHLETKKTWFAFIVRAQMPGKKNIRNMHVLKEIIFVLFLN